MFLTELFNGLDFRFLFVYNKDMLEKLNDPIQVLAQFNGKKIMPEFFKWRDKTYKIEKLNMVHKERDGNDKIYYFSVTDNANFFRLAFFTRDLSWKIEELWYEG